MASESAVPAVSKGARAIVFLAFVALALGSVGLFFWQVVLPSVSAGVPLRTFSWSSIALLLIGLSVINAWLGSGIYKRFGTELSPSGVSWPTLKGRAELDWLQVERASIRGHEVALHGAGKSVVINVFCFSNQKRWVTSSPNTFQRMFSRNQRPNKRFNRDARKAARPLS